MSENTYQILKQLVAAIEESNRIHLLIMESQKTQIENQMAYMVARDKRMEERRNANK